ncbi:DNA topoisomerase III, partial [Ventosimonas gracilis]
TWCFGHMLELAEPDEYTPDTVPRSKAGKKYWRVEDLPIIPTDWILKPKAEAKKQLAVIGKLIKQADEIVHAGDPDREGQLLVDEVLEHFHNKKPVKRFWVSAQDKVSIQRGLAALKNNQDYAGWANAARARSRADWLIGMNLSRAYTLSARRSGGSALLTVGRVQTPTLALVSARDRAIEAFVPVAYHRIRALFAHQNGSFSASWKPRLSQEGLDSEGRLINTAIADSLIAAINGKTGAITDYKTEMKTEAQPLAFALSDMTALASSQYGYSAEQCLKICQSLYETHKLTSYPRTDCAYLPQSQWADAPAVLAALKQVNPEFAALIDAANPTLKSPTWNDKKITAHHGIIPTAHLGNKSALSEPERNLYELIVRAYIAQFWPVHQYLQTRVALEVSGETFTASGKTVRQNGWKDVYPQADEDENKPAKGKAGSEEEDAGGGQHLPAMNTGEKATCTNAQRIDAQSKPPLRFTEGTLVRAMENIHRFVADPEHKKRLRDGDGIGTSATRASIISELKRRTFLETQGKQIRSSALGRALVDALPEAVKSPLLTALYERLLKAIEQGEKPLDEFVARQEAFVRTQVAEAAEGRVLLASAASGSLASGITHKKSAACVTEHACGACGSALVRRKGKAPKGGFWFGCSAFPACKQTYPETQGLPDYSKARATLAAPVPA